MAYIFYYILTFFLAYTLTVYLTFFLAFCLASILTFYLAFSGMSSGPGPLHSLLSSRYASGAGVTHNIPTGRDDTGRRDEEEEKKLVKI